MEKPPISYWIFFAYLIVIAAIIYGISHYLSIDGSNHDLLSAEALMMLMYLISWRFFQKEQLLDNLNYLELYLDDFLDNEQLKEKLKNELIKVFPSLKNDM